jgi:hypothetical protein
MRPILGLLGWAGALALLAAPANAAPSTAGSPDGNNREVWDDAETSAPDPAPDFYGVEMEEEEEEGAAKGGDAGEE